MKIGSFNIWGLGSKVKKEEVFSLFTKFELDVCCVQETKLESFSELDGRSLWGSLGLHWCSEGETGRSGGILTFWDDNRFGCSSHWSIGGAVVVVGYWRQTGERYCIVNVYAPCCEKEKSELWDRLELVLEQWKDVMVCVIGDFNSILNVGERVGT